MYLITYTEQTTPKARQVPGGYGAARIISNNLKQQPTISNIQLWELKGEL